MLSLKLFVDIFHCEVHVYGRILHLMMRIYSITEDNVKICFRKILKVNVFSRPLLVRNYMHGCISIDNISLQEIVVLNQQDAKSITNASIWLKFISKNMKTPRIEHSLLNSAIMIPCYGFHLRSPDLADKTH